MNSYLLTPPGMRLIKCNGVVITEAPVMPPGLADSEILERRTPEGRTHRERFCEAQKTINMLAQGWRPSASELQHAPNLSAWQPVMLPIGDIILLGFVTGHPYIRDGKFCSTSPLIAYDAQLAEWARTVSRWYRLGAPSRLPKTFIN
ncbi:MAG: hypothetical protein RO009_07955 [Pseudorhodoplanes sp.]|jgi:hypothetical protein|nr:hypothetical protein [Pseudorhodoplanes sp.]